MIKLLKLGLFLCVVNLFFLHDIHGQRIFKNKEVDFYTSGIQAMNTGSVFVADLNENDEFCNSVTVWNCTDGSLTIEILSALDVVGFQTVPSSHSLVMSLSSDRFDELTITAAGVGDILVNGIRDNRDVGSSAGNVNTAIYPSNCEEIEPTDNEPVIDTLPYFHKITGNTSDSVTHRLLQELIEKKQVIRSIDVECNELTGTWFYFERVTVDGEITSETEADSQLDCNKPQPDYFIRDTCIANNLYANLIGIIDGIETNISTTNSGQLCAATDTLPGIQKTSVSGIDTLFFASVKSEACFKGVKIPVTISYNIAGEVLWYSSHITGERIEALDFAGDCPPLTCSTRSESLCADGNYKGIDDGDELIVVFQDCSDGSSNIISAALLSDLTTPITLPEDVAFQMCANQTQTELLGCVTDEKGIYWNQLLVNGEIIAYTSQETGLFGTPNGQVTAGCGEKIEITGSLDGKHCINVKGDTLTAFLLFDNNGNIIAKPVGSLTTYSPEEYSIVSCCPTSNLSETVHFEGFEVQRPLGNTGWNNELTTGSPAINGDFELCYTVTASSGNSPNMIGITTDPLANQSYTTIDCANYNWIANGGYRIYEYENGANQGLATTTNFIGQEICHERVGGVLTTSLAGTDLFDCNIGTGPVYLDDSHYSTNGGFWGSGSITYSDFLLIQRQEDKGIKSVAECNVCCDQGGGSSTQSLNCIETGFVEEVYYSAYFDGSTWTELVNPSNGAIIRTGTGTHTVSFTTTHPEGNTYTVEFTEEVTGSDDIPAYVQNPSKTATGFSFITGEQDNGGGAGTGRDISIRMTVILNKETCLQYSLD